MKISDNTEQGNLVSVEKNADNEFVISIQGPSGEVSVGHAEWVEIDDMIARLAFVLDGKGAHKSWKKIRRRRAVNKTLTPKQGKFVQAIQAGHSPEQAYQYAGYSQNGFAGTVEIKAREMMENPTIKSALNPQPKGLAEDVAELERATLTIPETPEGDQH